MNIDDINEIEQLEEEEEEEEESEVETESYVPDQEKNEIIVEATSEYKITDQIESNNFNSKQAEGVKNSEINDTDVENHVTEDNVNVTPVFIYTNFGNKTQNVQFTIIATGQTGNTSITAGKIRLIYGRIYFLPINSDKDIDSDNFANLKIFSDMADKIDVRYINNSYAAIIPLQNNIIILDNTRLCVLW